LLEADSFCHKPHGKLTGYHGCACCIPTPCHSPFFHMCNNIRRQMKLYRNLYKLYRNLYKLYRNLYRTSGITGLDFIKIAPLVKQFHVLMWTEPLFLFIFLGAPFHGFFPTYAYLLQLLTHYYVYRLILSYNEKFVSKWKPSDMYSVEVHFEYQFKQTNLRLPWFYLDIPSKLMGNIRVKSQVFSVISYSIDVLSTTIMFYAIYSKMLTTLLNKKYK
jgi:hypothetical protein